MRGGAGVGDGGGLRHADAEHATGGARVARADADEHAGGAGAHEVQRGLVGGAAADDHRDVELADEALEVQRLDGLRDVLGRHDRALDDEQVELGGDDRCGELLGALRRDATRTIRRRRHGSADALADTSSGLIGSP